ncbi:MAG TPA: hypothetical protein DIT64_04770 [Verrucomicrobiales bacterium]|nr:hypothetical protein [Verrucomicrobiales bacterium]HCN76362.1 hypothetical protein [Verrucomicrobiales bacterium]HRJ07550.1 thiol-disulfide oxidoreductase DCC family protein [Prosthecobacter sp.]HRK13427.1 thiol-disulfide oxidoreductase DCC family protein [Prosthecobacter sp.]
MNLTPWTNLLLFDGVCHLCDSTVQFVLRHDTSGRIHFCPIQSETGSRLYREHGFDPAAPHTMLLLTPDGALRESDAAIEIARLLGGIWRLALVLKIIPRPLRDAAYRFIASRRYRWFGRHGACLVPLPEWRARFLQ